MRPSAMLGLVTDIFTIQGRQIGPPELTLVRTLLTEHPDWSRYQLSRHLADLWHWHTPTGQLKDMAARTLLLKLEQRGWIQLPARRRASPNRMRHKQVARLARPVSQTPITGPLAAFLPLSFTEVSPRPHQDERALYEALLHQYHYLSHRSPVGENLQYLVSDRQGRPLACVLFGAAAWQCAPRDEYIGWDSATRCQGLHRIASNTRFLIPPWVRVSCLASHLLSRIARRLSPDWQGKYGHPIYLLETFVDTSRFPGLCYRVANWIHVGQTTGRTRQNKTMIPAAPPKAVWLYPLRPDFRQALCAC